MWTKVNTSRIRTALARLPTPVQQLLAVQASPFLPGKSVKTVALCAQQACISLECHDANKL